MTPVAIDNNEMQRILSEGGIPLLLLTLAGEPIGLEYGRPFGFKPEGVT